MATSSADHSQDTRDESDPAALPCSWTHIQHVLDEALDAVKSARVRGADLVRELGEQRRIASELEIRCEELQSLYQETLHEAETTNDSLDQLRNDRDRLLHQFEFMRNTGGTYDEMIKNSKRLEERFRIIAESMAHLDRRTREIRDHYANDLDAGQTAAEEINLARDEALAGIREALKGVHIRQGAAFRAATAAHAAKQPR